MGIDTRTTLYHPLPLFPLQSRFREAFYKENIITAIVRRLQTDNEELQGYCANAIFKVSWRPLN